MAKNGILFLVVLLLFLTFSISSAQTPWKTRKGEGTFLVISDIHFDPYADKSLVVQLAKTPGDQWDGIFQSSQLTDPAGYGKDTNYPLWASCVENLQKYSKVDYVIVNGDYLSHHFMDDFQKYVHADTKDYPDFVEKTLIFVSKSIQDSLPNVPVYFCLGNNDSDCEDYEMTPHQS